VWKGEAGEVIEKSRQIAEIQQKGQGCGERER